MPPRPSIPTDDLYRRLGVPVDASAEAIEIAWRGLLRVHHPDVAGDEALETAKRINVAHDWLSDAGLRGRYDDARGIGRAARGRALPGGGATGGNRDRAADPWRAADRRPTAADQVAAVLERVRHLTTDELDRMSLAEPAPIAFLATLRRFASPEAQDLLDAAEIEAMTALPVWARRRPAIRDAVTGRVAEIVLGDSLDELLGESGGDRARERLTRGWDAAVGQPRYGPATPAVIDLLGHLSALSAEDVARLAATGARERLGEPPWPAAASPEEDEALRVSSELAGADAASAVPIVGKARAAPAGARRAAARIAHLLVLRHAFAETAFARHAAPWLGTFISPIAPWRHRSRRTR
jgi:hypothetical protein